MTPVEKRQMLQKQVDSKVYWGASKREIFEWLNEKHRLTGDEVEEIHSLALKSRVRAIRQRAVITLVFSLIGIVVFIAYLLFQWKGQFVVVGQAVVAMWILGGLSIAAFFRSIVEFVSGEKSGPID